MMDRRSMAARARGADGLLHRTDLEAASVSRRQQLRLVESGELVRMHQQVLAVGGAPATFEQRVRAAVMASGGFASHSSAARLHQLTRGSDSDAVHVLVPTSAHHGLSGIEVHRCRRILPRHVTSRRGIAVTTIERTLVDLGSTLSRSDLSACVEDALLARRITPERLEHTFNDLARRGRAGIARVRSVLEELGTVPTFESELERRFRQLLRRGRIPEPTWQPSLPWAEGEHGRVDALFETALLVVELDGRTFHGRTAAFERDRRRDQDAVLAGFSVVRITWAQLRDDEVRLVSLLRTLLQPN